MKIWLAVVCTLLVECFVASSSNHRALSSILQSAIGNSSVRALNQTVPQIAVAKLISAQSELPGQECTAIVEPHAKVGLPSDPLIAVRLNDLSRLKVLLETSPELANNFQEKSLLRTAASLGHVEICRYLIDAHHVDVNDFERGCGFPIITSAVAHPDVVRLLIEKGADLKRRLTRQGASLGIQVIGDRATVLHFAAADGVPETIKVLINNGADLFATADAADNFDRNQTSLDVAVIFGRTDNAIALLDHPSFQRSNQVSRKRLLDKGLLLAAYLKEFSDRPDRSKLVEALLKRGADSRVVEEAQIQAAIQGEWLQDSLLRAYRPLIGVLDHFRRGGRPHFNSSSGRTL